MINSSPVMADKNSEQPSERTRNDAETFPTLTAAQISRIAVHGELRQVAKGEVLVEVGEKTARIFVVSAGEMEIVTTSDAAEKTVAVLEPGMFTGEVTVLSGR